MHGFDENMKLQHYTSPEDIINAYMPIRLAGYVERKQLQQENLEAQCKVMSNKARFINAIIDGTIPMSGGGSGKTLTNKELVEYLKSEGYAGKSDIYCSTSRIFDGSIHSNEYMYLLYMSISSLTIDRANALNGKVLELETQLAILNKTTPEDMWLSDLARLDAELSKYQSYQK